MSNAEMFRYCWVWEKTNVSNPQLAKRQPLKNHEDVTVFSFQPHLYYPQGLEACVKERKKDSSNLGHCVRKAYTQTATNYPKSIIKIPSERGLHPTQKPVALMEYLIRTYTNEGELVLDNTAGSFTTGVAAFRTGRKFIGIERDPDYFKIGVCRLCDEARALSLCGTTDRDILSWKVDWPFQEIQNPYTALCDELVSNPQ